MNVIEMRLADLQPYEKNPRKNDEAVKYVAESIKQFGFKVPIVIDKNNIIVCGHTRYKASRKLHLDTVPCVIADDLTEEQIKAYRLADNKVSEQAEWDTELLELELDDIIDIDMSEFGFDFDGIEADETDVDEDDYTEPEELEPKAKKGDIYQLGRHRLMCGDSTDINDIKKLLDGNNIDLVLTDAPYGVDVVKSGKVGADFGVAKKGEYFAIKGDDTTDTAKLCYEALKELGIEKYILFGGNYFTDFLPFSDSWLIWDKRGDTGIKNTFADGEMAWCSFHTPVRIYHQLWNGMIREGEHDKRVHPTQKPVRMLSEIIRDFSEDSNNILDCFGGSGSTLIACEQTNRSCYMLEYEPHYIDVIIDRWQKYTGQEAKLING